MIKFFVLLITFPFFLFTHAIYAQAKKAPDTIPSLNLDQCIAYALVHQPNVEQASINIAIAKKTNFINLSYYLPQLNAEGDLYHYIVLPTSYVNGEPAKTGVYDEFDPQLDATETFFAPGLIYAAKSAHLYVQQAKQQSDSAKIGIIAAVSTAFFNLLNSLEEINVLAEDTAEFAKSFRDAYHQYVGGIEDRTDYEQAIITLNNAKVQLKQELESVKPNYATLKMEMGFPPGNEFNVNFDTGQMMNQIKMDTTQQLQYDKRIEYQLLKTQRGLQQQTINYYKYEFLPSITAFYNYTYEYENNNFSNLFPTAYPNSYIGASFNIPIFTGFGRIESVQRAKLQEQLIDLNIVNEQEVINTQYLTALGNYKSNLYALNLLNENVIMAKDVYKIVSFQYRQGIVPYLNVITAEDNLVSSESSYINTMFQVMLDKVDLDKAMGNIVPK